MYKISESSSIRIGPGRAVCKDGDRRVLLSSCGAVSRVSTQRCSQRRPCDVVFLRLDVECGILDRNNPSIRKRMGDAPFPSNSRRPSGSVQAASHEVE